MILLINPRSARWNHRVPLSVLAVGAGLEGKYEYEIIDQNYDPRIETTLKSLISARDVRYVGLTVMPGPQLTQAINLSMFLRSNYPAIKIIWGGTFPTIHAETVLKSSLVDFVIWSQGEFALPELVRALEGGRPLDGVRGISFKRADNVVHTASREWIHPDLLPPLPYRRINVRRYLQRTYLGNRTTAYHSSFGCPFHCGFCSVVAMFDGKWLAQKAENIVRELAFLQQEYGIDSVEFFDDNFFVSEKRTLEFSERVKPLGISWWGEGRSDTLLKYSDRTLREMRAAGCRMIFTGAESSSEETLSLMNKGGTQSPETILDFARRIKEFDIVPEFSFIFGSPDEEIDRQIEADIAFIRRIKDVNPRSEIIFYVYAPVLLPGAKIFELAKKYGFDYPKTLEEWLEPRWQHLDLRKNPMTPWLTPAHITKIRNFERVLNAYYPTISDLKITAARKKFLRLLSGWRYNLGFYAMPYEIRFVLSKVFHYRRPETEGAEQYAT
jgi:radical SAM superfamily enzyme YgiQ (UPF0313 family)